MIPLLSKPSPNANPNDTSFSSITSIHRTGSKYFKAFCISTVLLFIVAIAIVSYFNFGTNTLHNSNPARSLHTKKSVKVSSDNVDEFYKSSGVDDEIVTDTGLAMPNLDITSCEQAVTADCAFKQYSGYLLANDDNEIHYWFIQSDTADDPLDKPLFFWTNGGPGCSGLDGLLTEHGPWKVMPDLSIQYNPYTWIREANIVYLEQPYGVGFSVADDGDVVVGDHNAAADMDAVIRNFLVKFPDYKNSDIYLSSESWGGHYVPMTSYTILQNNDAGVEPYINFRGFLLGNPYTDWYENTYGFVGEINGHGLMEGHDWNVWRRVCWNNSSNIENDPRCSAIYSRAYISSANSNVYALDWPQCLWDENWNEISAAKMDRWTHQKRAPMHKHVLKYMSNVLNHPKYEELDMRIDKDELTAVYNGLVQKKSVFKNTNNVRRLRGGGNRGRSSNSDAEAQAIGVNYEPCIEYAMARYLNLPYVQRVLNVKNTEWEMCNDAVSDAWPESDYNQYMQEYYTKIIREYAAKLGLKMCIYSGDDDSVCGLSGTQFWLDEFETCEASAKTNWVAWEDDSAQLGGFHTEYVDENGSICLHLVTVRTAGHMVPTTEPMRALELLQTYLYVLESS